LTEAIGGLVLDGGICASHRLVPAAFIVRFGSAIATVVNHSQAPSDQRSLVMCRGADFGSLPA
jgi:hypothetical protein